jgi:hypothetical protein
VEYTTGPSNDTPVAAVNKIHIGDIEASNYYSEKKKWKTIMNLIAHDSNENVVPNAEISGNWSSVTTTNGACIIDISDSCQITTPPIWNTDVMVTFTVDNVSHANMYYDPSVNHDLDGDSDGSSITVFFPDF